MSTCLTVLTAATVLWVNGVLSKCLAVLYGSNSPLGQVRSITKAFLFLLRVRLTKKSSLILVGAAVSFVRVLATATVIFSAVVRVIYDTGTELLHRTLQSSVPVS